MAVDAALLDEVAAGALPALRLYRWHVPALSLGRFQADDDVNHDACARLGVEVVRRPTGGKALLHGADLTYAVVMPRPVGGAGRVDAIYCTLAAGLVSGLAHLGIDAHVAQHAPGGEAGPVCFTSMQGADLRVGTRKLCGSAQVRRGGAVLQHGSVLLDRLAFDESDLIHPSGHAAVDVGAVTVTLWELGAASDPESVAGALVRGFRETLDVEFT
jgi:lipoyl(octanoyl) transferase